MLDKQFVPTEASCVEAYDALSGLKSFEELKQKKIVAGRNRNRHKRFFKLKPGRRKLSE